MKLISNLGRFIYAIPFIVFGINHFLYANMMAGYILKGWPIAQILVYVTGTALILAGVAIIIKVYARLACILLAVLLLIFIVALHIPGLNAEATRMMAMSSLLKDMSLMGAALTYAGIFK